MSDLDDEGIKLYAISYDDPDALSDFVSGAGIEFTMLSDAHSRVIRQYGVLNTLIDENEQDGLFYGIPFPGFFLIDEAGMIRDKLFNPHFAVRSGIESVLDGFAGRAEQRGDEPSAAFTEDDGIGVTAFLRGDALKVGPQRRLVVRFAIPDGLHIYGTPVPAGMVATSITVEGPPGMHFEATEQPTSRPFELPGVDGTLQVWENEVDFVIPLFLGGSIAKALNEGSGSELELKVHVRYQACDDHQCFIPRTQTLSLQIPVGQNVMPEFIGKVLGHEESETVGFVDMDTMTHLKRLSTRQKARTTNTA